jgi:hypothetical protein
MLKQLTVEVKDIFHTSGSPFFTDRDRLGNVQKVESVVVCQKESDLK